MAQTGSQSSTTKNKQYTKEELRKGFLEGGHFLTLEMMENLPKNRMHPQIKGCSFCGSKQKEYYAALDENAKAQHGLIDPLEWECIDCSIKLFLAQRNKD